MGEDQAMDERRGRRYRGFERSRVVRFHVEPNLCPINTVLVTVDASNVRNKRLSTFLGKRKYCSPKSYKELSSYAFYNNSRTLT